jgi:3-phosphoshikimate 1-carboxyvinyltransferase
VSRPYIEMTLNLMAFFGIEYEWKGNSIKILPQKYKPKDFKVEADWSAASYYYAIAAFSDSVDLRLNNLWKKSVQGDAVIAQIMEQFGIMTSFNEKGIRIRKSGKSITSSFEWDFIKCPDIAQTMAVVCSGLGTKAVFSGLETLRIKETDRIAALETELKKVNISFLKTLPPSKDPKKEYFLIEGKPQVNIPLFKTYEDHRMAMAFAPLALFGKISIEDPFVVEKSYPKFWKDFIKLGFQVEENQ